MVPAQLRGVMEARENVGCGRAGSSPLNHSGRPSYMHVSVTHFYHVPT